MALTLMTSLFGEVHYEPDEVYIFEQGLPGFPDKREFLFIKVADSPFIVMHSLADDLYFFLIDPFHVQADYEFAIPKYALEQLNIDNRDNVLCYSIVVLREPLSDSTANLAAPVILNTQQHKGMQLVLENTRYSVRHPIFIKEEASLNEPAVALSSEGSNAEER
jgi:flagellar assembly factor FliW